MPASVAASQQLFMPLALEQNFILPVIYIVLCQT